MNNKDADAVIIGALRVVLEKCEETGKFPFNSRRFFHVGEWQLAFEGIYMFAEGNHAFKGALRPEYDAVLKQFETQLDFECLPAKSWA